MYQPWLDEGFARPGARRTRDDFEIAATCHLQITAGPEETQAVLDVLKPVVALYMGGMGAKEQNFHKNVFERMGYADLTDEVQELYLAGKQGRGRRADPRRAGRRHAHRRHGADEVQGRRSRAGRRPA